MIPREIPKPIQPVELRTNRLVNETLAGALSTKPRVLNREIRQMREKGKGLLVLSCSRISRGSRLKIILP